MRKRSWMVVAAIAVVVAAVAAFEVGANRSTDESDDPGPVPGLTPESKVQDFFVKTGRKQQAHVQREWEYLKRTRQYEQVANAFIEYLKKLPPVADVERLEIDSEWSHLLELKVTMKHGDPWNYAPGYLPR